MKTKRIMIFLSLVAAGAMSQNGGKVADLPAGLQEALQRDAVCETAQDAVAPDKTQFLDSLVAIQNLHGAGGVDLGVIVAPQDGCHCQGASCSTYVYLKSGQDYKLAFSHVFTSLHAMKGFKRGYPSLTGKLQLDESKAETTVYDWTGSRYLPSLCATITQPKGQRRPTIVRHECGKLP